MSKPYVKRPRLLTPAVPVEWAFVQKPHKKYKKEDEFEYSITARLNAEQAAEMEKLLRPMAEAAKAEAVSDQDAKPVHRKSRPAYELSYGMTPECDKETGDETGVILMKIKCNASYIDKKSQEVRHVTIPVFDAKKNPMKDAIGRGSICKILFEPGPYCMDATKKVGVSLRLMGVQVLDLKPVGVDVTDEFSVEDGYDSSDGETPFEADNVPATSKGNPNTGDF